MCYVMECAHGEWVGQSCRNPTLRLVTAAFLLSPSPSDLFIRSDWVQTVTSVKPGTRGDTWEVTGFTIYQTERRIPTDLSAAGQVEVEETVAALPCGQVHKPFICECVAVGQTQVLKVETVPVRNQQISLYKKRRLCVDYCWLFCCCFLTTTV